MALLTSFRASGHCKNCGDAREVWIQSHLGSDGATYRIGDDVSADINPAAIAAVCFLIREPAKGDPIHVGTAWWCERCNTEDFAEVVFAHGCVVDIRPVELSVKVLDRLNYFEQSYYDKIEFYTKHSMWDERGVWPPWVRVLREVLAREEGQPVSAPEQEEFPMGVTLNGGRYRLDEHYLGYGTDQLWFARSTAEPGVRFLVSITSNNGLDLTADGPELRRPANGLFIPRFLGELDLVNDAGVEDLQRRFKCAYVEELPEGQPVRTICKDLRQHAVHFGAQIGALLQRATADGVFNVGLRPEYVWAKSVDGIPVVTGIGGRNGSFFDAARRRRDLNTLPLLRHSYRAPEVYRGEPYDDRALVLTLAVIITEWLIGQYPYVQDDAWGYNRLCEGDHMALPGPPPLTDLLARALRPDPALRPDLATFTRELARLSHNITDIGR